jgi:UDP-glucose 4-epimerase
MRIFITGIAGFLGSHIADLMIKKGHEVVGCDNLIGGYLDNVPVDAEFHQVDCGYLNTMVKITKGCEVIYHTACTAYEGLSVFSPHLISKNSYQITSTMLSASITNNCKRFIYCSSMARYGEQEKVPFREDMECKPQDPYGIAKYAGELLVRNLCNTHGMEYVIAVPHNIIGPRQKYDDPFRNVAAIMINLMLQGRQPIVYGDGTQKRCFSYIDDVIYCLDKLAFESDVAGDIFNIGPDEEFITINELAELIARKLDFKLDPIYVPERPQEVRLATCSADKARERLGYQTKVTLSEAIDHMIDYVRKRKPKRFMYHLDIEIMNDACPRTWVDRLF